MTTCFVTAPADELTVVAVDRARWPVDRGTQVPTGHLRVTLDLTAGRLAIVADPPDALRNDHGPQKYPGSWVHRWDFPVPVPHHMTWEISGLYRASAEPLERLLELIAAQARVILGELVPITGRAAGGFDWSLRAAAAVRVIDSFTSDWWGALSETCVTNAAWTLEHYYKFGGLLDMTDALEVTPELASPEWAVLPDAELDAAAAKLARMGPYDLRPEWREAAHLDPDDRFRRNTPIYLVGVLATLYRLRADQAGALTPVDASAWFGGRVAVLTVIDDSTTEAELARLALAEQCAAAAVGKGLLGALAYLTAIRTAHRQRIRQQLADPHDGAHSSRAALLLRIDGWGDPQDGDQSNRNATLARLAGISRELVLSLRERAHEVNTAHPRDHRD